METQTENQTPANSYAPTPEQMAEIEASGGRKTWSISDKGGEVKERAQSSIENQVKREVEEQIEERDLSRAERRMRARRKARPDIVQPVEITEDGEAELWFVTAISDADFCEMGVCMALDGFTVTDLSEDEAQRSFNAASLYVALVVSEDDRTRYFETFEEAKEFHDDPRNAAQSLALRSIIHQVNPFLSGQKKSNAPTVRLLARNHSQP